MLGYVKITLGFIGSILATLGILYDRFGVYRARVILGVLHGIFGVHRVMLGLLCGILGVHRVTLGVLCGILGVHRRLSRLLSGIF